MPKISNIITKRSKKLVESEEEDSDADYQDYGGGAEVEDDFETQNSHSNLINSFDTLVKTNKRRVVPEEIEVSGAVPTSLGLCQAAASGQGDDEEWLTIGKVLEGIKDKALKAKSAAALTSSKKSKKTKTKSLSLTTSLEKPVVQTIQRAILYDHVKKDVSKWNSVVYHNRLAEQLVFPLEAGQKLPKPTSKDLIQDFVPQTRLEVEIAKILHGPEYVERKQAEIFGKAEVESEAGAYVKNIEEALEKHSELSRLRALQSYEMAKAKRRNKIKSKKYHRLLRRDKIRKQLKEFEELQEKDPAAAMLKLEELDKARVQERMSLKHRNTSKWAKMQAVRAKYNRESRVALSEQLKISRDLTVKVAESSDDDEDYVDLDVPDLVKNSLNNPWFVSPSDPEKEKMELYYTGYKKVWSEINARKERDAKREEADAERQRAEAKGENSTVAVKAQPRTKKMRNKLRKEACKKLKAEQRMKLAEETESVTLEVDHRVQGNRKLEVEPEPEIGQISLIPDVDVEIDSDSGEELTVDGLNNLLSRAHDKIVKKASIQLKALTPVVEPKKHELKRRKAPEIKPKAKRNRDGDIDEIRDLTVDETEINFEGGAADTSTVDLVSVRLREASSLARGMEEHDSAPKPSTKPVSLINVADYLQIGKGPKFNMSEVHAEQAEEDEDEGQIQNIAEAFEDDDVIAEFQKHKEEQVDAGKAKDVDLSLPGWGEWGGKDLKPSTRKKNRFVLKAPPKAPRKDANLSHVILNEAGSEKLKAHQVRQLPFPYSRVKDFEKMVRAPVGRTWLPEKAMKSLTTPKIITRLGAVIQPISEDVLINKPETTRNLKLAGLKARK